jgi:hypothetical protein
MSPEEDDVEESGISLALSLFTGIGWWAVAPTGTTSPSLRRTP